MQLEFGSQCYFHGRSIIYSHHFIKKNVLLKIFLLRQRAIPPLLESRRPPGLFSVTQAQVGLLRRIVGNPTRKGIAKLTYSYGALPLTMPICACVLVGNPFPTRRERRPEASHSVLTPLRFFP